MTTEQAAYFDWVREQAMGSAALFREAEAAVTDEDRAALVGLGIDLNGFRLIKGPMPSRILSDEGVAFVYVGDGQIVVLDPVPPHRTKNETA